MTELLVTIKNINRQINPDLKVGGIFMTMTNETNLRKEVVALVRENYGKHLPVFQSMIPATVRLAEVSTKDKSIFLHDSKGPAAEAYRNLVKEVMEIGEKQRCRQTDLAR